MPLEVKDILDFIKDYDVLKGWRPEDIVKAITSAIDLHTLAYTVDDATGKLTSICIAKWHDNCCGVHIIAVAGIPGSLRALIKHLKKNYPNVKTLTAYRSGKFVEYNVAKNLW